MAPTFATSAAPVVGQRLAYRLAIPVFALLLFAALAALWRWGPHSTLFRCAKAVGLRAVSLSVSRHPCGSRRRPMPALRDRRLPLEPVRRARPPACLFAAVARDHPRFSRYDTTTAVGLGLDLMFILSLAALIRPATWGEVLILALTALSPMTVYALERANCRSRRLLVRSWGMRARPRAPAVAARRYALYFFAGLLKYYPLVLLVLIARERRRDAIAIGATAGCVLLVLAVCGRSELAKALANIPSASYYAGSFSAREPAVRLGQILNGIAVPPARRRLSA